MKEKRHLAHMEQLRMRSESHLPSEAFLGEQTVTYRPFLLYALPLHALSLIAGMQDCDQSLEGLDLRCIFYGLFVFSYS